MQQVSKDLPTLKTLISSALHNSRASIPESHQGWIVHLMELYRLYKIDPAMVHYCTWYEVQGLMTIQDAMQESASARKCPRCQQPTKSLYDCETCGMRLQ